MKKLSTVDDKITVCNKCLMACCWQGEHMCLDAPHAGTVQKTRKKLLLLGLEHPRYLKTDEELSQGEH